MKILITGGAGRLGQYVADVLTLHHEIVLFDVTDSGSKYPVVIGDVLSQSDVASAMDGCNAVIHLAGIHILTAQLRKIWEVNTGGTLNVLECMVQCGCKRLVLASSICAVGFIHASSPMPVEIFPVDESYTGVPDDLYGLSKTAAELLAQAYVRRHGLDIVSLRLATVCFPDIPCSVDRLERHSKAEGAPFLWNYVDARDAARACALAAETPLAGHLVLNIGADETCAPETTRKLVEQYYPGKQWFAAGFDADGHAALWNAERAERAIGFRPQYCWRDYPCYR